MAPPLALLLGAALLPAAQAAETRGVWVVRTALTSPESVDEVVERAHEAGLNTLFIQVRGRGDAFYNSRIVPRSPLLAGQPSSFDPLQRAIDRADRYGMKVHAWLNVLLSAGFAQPVRSDHVVSQHPEWLMLPRSVAARALGAKARSIPDLVRRAGRGRGDVEGYYLSPSAPGVAPYLEEVVREVMGEYGVDGVHFDFIRYPSADYDYSRAALEGFARGRRSDRALVAAVAQAPAAFADYRRDVLTALAARLGDAARRERPGVIVSAAVVPDPGVATVEKGQAWASWISEGILDALCPMVYTESASLFRHQVGVARSLVPSTQMLWAGIGAWRLSADDTVTRVHDARSAGASGVIVFSHESLLRSDTGARLREGAFAKAADAGDVEVAVTEGLN